MLVYLAGTITGLTVQQSQQWRQQVSTIISDLGHTALDPAARLDLMYKNKEDLIGLEPPGDTLICKASNSAEIFVNDFTDVYHCNIIFANLLDNPSSIGTHFELGSFYTRRFLSEEVLTSVVVIPDQYHYHPFIKCHNHVVSTLDEGIDILKQLLCRNT